ncbi:phage portal protein [Brevundimonas naejangsanensis]|uniref:phage portal protein n=1 Tax=Brevundimonas naejangsanensis TaxID=588932 RepID=UPI0026E9DF83|nr:phage portal protein [Brevundimonas naejangsanensis]
MMGLFSRVRRAPQRRRFDAAATGRGWSQQRSFRSLNLETLQAFATVRARARHAYANDPHIRAAVEAWVTALAGAGARPQPGHPDAARREAIIAALDDWADVADISARSDFWGQQAEFVRSMVIDGEALVQLLDTADGLRLRHLPTELLDESETRVGEGGAYTLGGVEFDRHGRRVAYWIRPEVPAAHLTWTPAERVDARDVLHIFRPLAAGQVRGISWLAPVLLTAHEVDKLADALTVGAQVAAAYAGILQDNSLTGAELTDEGRSDPIADGAPLVPGTIRVIGVDQTLTLTTPPQAQMTLAFLESRIRSIASGAGVPAHLVSGDLSKANYGSLRADMVAFRQRCEVIQYGTIAPQLLRPVYARAVTSLILSGDLDASDFEAARRDWLRADWLFPAPPWIDPAKDAAAEALLVQHGFKSRSQVIAERGWSPEAIDAQISADRERERALGLTFGPQSSPQKESRDDDDDA